MQIHLTNKTKFRNDDLRDLLKASLRAVGYDMRKSRFPLRVEVNYGRRRGAHGRASLGHNRVSHGLWMKLTLPRPEVWTNDTWRDVVAVTVHECMHLVGSDHKDMTEAQYHCTLPLPAWAGSLTPLREAESVPEPLRRAATRGDRIEHARAMLQKAEHRAKEADISLRREQTRVKRARTLLTKWKRRVSAMTRAPAE